MASYSLSTPNFQGPLIHKSQLWGQKIAVVPKRTISSACVQTILTRPPTITAKFDLSELMGGRGLCNGELGLQQELKREIETQPDNPGNPSQTSAEEKEEELTKKVIASTEFAGIPEDGFEKELFGLTGGFPGGEKGLQKFIEGKPLPDPMKLQLKLPELKLNPPQLSSFTENDNKH